MFIIRLHPQSNEGIHSTAMRQLSFLASVIYFGLTVTILTEASFGREPASGVTRFLENENRFRRPAIHRRGDTPLIRSGATTGRSDFLNNRRLKRRRLARSGDQNISEDTTYQITYPDTSNRYKSTVTEPEFSRFVPRSAPWQEENIRPQQARQSRRIKYRKRNTDNFVERKNKDNDVGMMIRYVQPRFSGDNSASYYNGEEMDDVLTYTHARPTHEGPQHYCPYCRHAQYIRQNLHNDQEPDHYFPYQRFAFRSNPQPELETTFLDTPHTPVPMGYQVAGNLPSGYKPAGTQTEHRPGLQNVSEDETMRVSAEQKLKGFVATETEEKQERNGETIDAKRDGKAPIGVLESQGGSREEIGEVADLRVEEKATDTGDSVDDKVSAEINKPNAIPTFLLRPLLTSVE